MESLSSSISQTRFSPLPKLMQPDIKTQYGDLPKDSTLTAEDYRSSQDATPPIEVLPDPALGPDAPEIEAGAGPTSAETAEQQELRRLRLENEYLRKQRDLYRKACGVVGAHSPRTQQH
jgi:hypothetical protein